MLYHRQIPELTKAARAVPTLAIVLDHFGCIIGVGPYRGYERETFAVWRDDVARLATCPNVSVKLGGLGMVICGPDWHERPNPPTSVGPASRRYNSLAQAVGLNRSVGCFGRHALVRGLFIRFNLFFMALLT